MVPNGGAVSEFYENVEVTLSDKETILIEPSYPIVLEDTGDTIQVGGHGGTLNVLVNGDKEV